MTRLASLFYSPWAATIVTVLLILQPQCTAAFANLQRRILVCPDGPQPFQVRRVLVPQIGGQSCPSLSNVSLGLFNKRRHHHQSSNDAGSPSSSRSTGKSSLRQWLGRWIRQTLFSFALALSIWMQHPNISNAAPREQHPKTISLRPGMTTDQVKAIESGRLEVLKEISSMQSNPLGLDQQKSTEASKVLSDYGDFADEDDVDFIESAVSTTIPKQQQAAPKPAKTSSTFAAYHQKKTNALYFKVGLGFFGPTYGFLFIREYVRRRREEAYVQKGLEILKAQKAEYFNMTETEDAQKSNATSTDDEDDDDDDDDDDEDDDDDDDDDDEDERPQRRRTPPSPRKPQSDGGGGGARKTQGDGGGGGRLGGDSGKPSDEDLDRLNKIFGKS